MTITLPPPSIYPPGAERDDYVTWLQTLDVDPDALEREYDSEPDTKAYNPDEPRGAQGRRGEGAGGSSAQTVEEIDTGATRGLVKRDPFDRLVQDIHRELEAKYNPDQPRDEHGRWGSGGGSSGGVLGDSSTKSFANQHDWQVATDNSNLVSGFDAYGKSAQDLKGDVASALATRLQGNSNWQTLVDHRGVGAAQMYPGTNPEAVAAEVVATWAGNSGDGSTSACALQAAAAQEFGLDAPTGHMSAYQSGQANYGESLAGLQAVERAQYDSTQEYLKSQGITEVVGYRGIGYQGLPAGVDAIPGRYDSFGGRVAGWQLGDPQELKVDMQPLSSFSSDPHQALNFSEHAGEAGQVIAMRIPAERVFSTPRTGFGCKGEGEIVMLGGRDLPARSYAWKSRYESVFSEDVVKMLQPKRP